MRILWLASGYIAITWDKIEMIQNKFAYNWMQWNKMLEINKKLKRIRICDCDRLYQHLIIVKGIIRLHESQTFKQTKNNWKTPSMKRIERIPYTRALRINTLYLCISLTSLLILPFYLFAMPSFLFFLLFSGNISDSLSK